VPYRQIEATEADGGGRVEQQQNLDPGPARARHPRGEEKDEDPDPGDRRLGDPQTRHDEAPLEPGAGGRDQDQHVDGENRPL
jgi:hypothetical protein